MNKARGGSGGQAGPVSREQVTVCFIDIDGYSGMAATMDPNKVPPAGRPG